MYMYIYIYIYIYILYVCLWICVFVVECTEALHVLYTFHSSVRSRVQEKTFVFFGPDRAGGPTEMSSMNRNFNDLFTDYGQKSFFLDGARPATEDLYIKIHMSGLRIWIRTGKDIFMC